MPRYAPKRRLANVLRPVRPSLRFAAENVQGAVVPHSGHWVMEENPSDTMALVLAFLAK